MAYPAKAALTEDPITPEVPDVVYVGDMVFQEAVGVGPSEGGQPGHAFPYP